MFLSFVIARHAVPTQSRREEAIMRLLRFARNDMEARIRYAAFCIASIIPSGALGSLFYRGFFFPLTP